ncbi:hypothetical protein HUO09_17625 [Vibrio sp. Y2-5]|uniref:hypothetical protein n=1 Tax=Vibrio sp. Y2-5 TaxID=2743977 RepID=UPI001661655F|nr:hypothetical protein [Vibrio sp. Y2-5]MBD0788178.1 hypothetical protein [Vibrio sp. Y2-5]
MSLYGFPTRFKNFNEAKLAGATLNTNGSIDAVDSLLSDLSLTGYYDIEDICDMFLKVLPEPYLFGAMHYSENGIQYFISNTLICSLISLVEDDRTTFGSFSQVIDAFIAHKFGQRVRTELVDTLSQHFHEVTAN